MLRFRNHNPLPSLLRTFLSSALGMRNRALPSLAHPLQAPPSSTIIELLF